MFDFWKQKIPLVERAYNLNNYKIEYNESTNNNECVIYFSSNNIWYPNTEEAFRKNIIEDDRYEWHRNSYRIGKKNIYLRE